MTDSSTYSVHLTSNIYFHRSAQANPVTARFCILLWHFHPFPPHKICMIVSNKINPKFPIRSLNRTTGTNTLSSTLPRFYSISMIFFRPTPPTNLRTACHTHHISTAHNSGIKIAQQIVYIIEIRVSNLAVTNQFVNFKFNNWF